MQELYCIEKMAASGIHIEKISETFGLSLTTMRQLKKLRSGDSQSLNCGRPRGAEGLHVLASFALVPHLELRGDFSMGSVSWSLCQLCTSTTAEFWSRRRGRIWRAFTNTYFPPRCTRRHVLSLTPPFMEPNLENQLQREVEGDERLHCVQQRSFQGAWAQASRRRTLACLHVSTTRQRCMAQSSVNHRALQTLAQSFLSVTSTRHNSFSRQPLEIPTDLRARLPRMYRRTWTGSSENRALSGTGS